MRMLDWGAGLRLRLVSLLLIALIPLFGLFAFVATKSLNAAYDLARAGLQSEALLAAAGQQRLVDRVVQLLSDIADGPSIKNPGLRLCSPYLRNLKGQDMRYANLGVIDLQGNVVCQALEGAPAVNVADRSFVKQIMAGAKFSIAEYAVGRMSGRSVIVFAVPVYADDGVFNGIAFAALDSVAVADALAAAPAVAGSQLRVLDRQGLIIAALPDGKPLQGKSETDPTIRQAIGKPQQGVSEATGPDGVARIYAIAPVGGLHATGLLVAVSVPREVVVAGPRMAFYRDLGALLAMTAFGICAAWWLATRSIVRPAHDILRGAEEITLGNLSARVNVGPMHRGEFGSIGLAFNRMAEALQARGNDVNAALREADAERALLDLVVNSMSEGVVAADADGKILLLNATAHRLFSAPGQGEQLDDWRRDHQLVALDGKTPFPKSDWPLERAIRGISTDNREVFFRRPGFEDRVFRLSARPLHGAGRQLIGGVLVFNDVTDLKAAEDLTRGQNEVLALIASGATVERALRSIVRLVESRSAASFCSILLVDDGKLHHGATERLPDSFVQAIEGLPVGEGCGACGTAAARRQNVVVADVANDPLMKDYREVALSYGLQACWSVPVLSASGEVLATFAIYQPVPSVPQPRDEELLEIATRLARIALERAQAEAALVSGEARFRELAENIQDVFYNVDAKSGTVLYISPGYERIWGRSCESLYADRLSYAAAVIAEDLRKVTRARELNRVGRGSDTEYRIRNATGDLRWVRDRSYPVRGADGELERIVGTARDITERKRAETALGNTNRALQMLSRSSIAINRIDDEVALLTEVCKVAVDPGGYRLAWVGYARDDAMRSIEPQAFAGENDGYLSPALVSWDEQRRSGQGPAGKAVRSGKASQSGDIANEGSTFLWRDAALQRGYRSAICLPLRDAERVFGVLCLYSPEVQQFPEDEVRLLQEFADNLAFGIGSLRAQLEKRRSREAARLAAIQLSEQASLLDRAQDAIMVRNLDRTLRYWNKGAENLYGWSAEEVIGRSMDELMYRSPEQLARAMEATLSRDGDWSGELEQVARDGSTVFVEARWTVVRDEHGTVNGVLGINTDIGERRRARDEILRLNATLEERVQQRTAQLEFANQQLEAFSYSVSHDLRTPLSSVDGFSNLLGKNLLAAGIEGPLAERNKHYLTRIRAGVSRMGELIDALLSLAHVSRSSLRWEPVDLSAQAQALLAGYGEETPGRVVEWRVEPGLAAHGDPRLLNQVLDNLLGNAWKFSAGRERGEIAFGSELNPAGERVYRVSDNGAGFNMAYADKLFGAFQRLHSSDEFAGTGVGLATVQRIIARHGGQVWGESEPGKGAVFYFTLGDATL